MAAEQGSIIWVSFDPSVGHEPSKRRPALVVSSDYFNYRCSLTVVLPITSTDSGFPYHVRIDQDGVRGFACVEQMKVLDLEARPHQVVGRLDGRTLSEVLNLVGSVFDI